MCVSFTVFGFIFVEGLCRGYRDITPIMENQIESRLEMKCDPGAGSDGGLRWSEVVVEICA